MHLLMKIRRSWFDAMLNGNSSSKSVCRCWTIQLQSNTPYLSHVLVLLPLLFDLAKTLLRINLGPFRNNFQVYSYGDNPGRPQILHQMFCCLVTICLERSWTSTWLEFLFQLWVLPLPCQLYYHSKVIQELHSACDVVKPWIFGSIQKEN